MAAEFWHLKQCNLFEQLTADEIRELERRARVRKFARGTPVYLPMDAAEGVLLLAKGRVKICGFSPEGKQTILALIEPGEIFGELAVLDESSRDEHAEAAVNCTVVLIPADAIRTLMDQRPGFTLGVTRLIGWRRKRIERRLKYLLFHSNRERLTHLLLELVEDYGRPTPADGIEISIKLSHQDLASIIGSTRESVTILLGQLRDEGCLRIVRRSIFVTDVAKLSREAGVATSTTPRPSPPPGATPTRKL